MAAASCVAVLSATNVPLYIHSADPSRALADQYSLHTSLDVIEEKTGAHFASSATDSNIKKTNPAGASAVVAPPKGEQSRDLYLGTLFATEKQKVYGYVTNTRIKFILIVDSSNATSLRDNEIRQMFRKLHTVYTQLLSNPFYVPGNQIKSKRFDSLVLSLVQPGKN